MYVLATRGTTEEDHARQQTRHLAEKGIRVSERDAPGFETPDGEGDEAAGETDDGENENGADSDGATDDAGSGPQKG